MAGEGKRNRQRGDRFERAVIKRLQDYGIAAQRVPNSGSSGGAFGGDINSPVLGVDRRFECKKRKTLPAYLIEPLGSNYGTFFACDHGETFVLLKAETFAKMLASADAFRATSAALLREAQPETSARPRVRHGEDGA